MFIFTFLSISIVFRKNGEWTEAPSGQNILLSGSDLNPTTIVVDLRWSACTGKDTTRVWPAAPLRTQRPTTAVDCWAYMFVQWTWLFSRMLVPVELWPYWQRLNICMRFQLQNFHVSWRILQISCCDLQKREKKKHSVTANWGVTWFNVRLK